MSDNNSKNKGRRKFIQQTALSTVGLGLMGMSAKSYANIIGANDRVTFGVVGMHGRGKALAKAISDVKNTRIKYVCDVDSNVMEKARSLVKELSGKKAKGIQDIRELVEKKDLDAFTIATPDHWHAPMTLLGVAAGKHVYVEKPCSHNPHEGELLVKAQKKYGKVIQMGNQQRSAPTSQTGVREIKEGLIGDVHYAKCWYTNNRGSIGTGKPVDVPRWLDWELWQGPAPRSRYMDNYVHYNWHWFWDYGTGEINNNGTHEIDICRWALGVDYPIRVTSSGGRFNYNDDWEFYDTQVATFEFDGDKMISWEGKSCDPHGYFNRGRGSIIYGSKGSMLLDRNGYVLYDLSGKVVREEKEKAESATTNIVGAGALDTYHMANFINAIRRDEKQNSPIDEGHKTNLLCHLGNIAQKTGRVLHTDAENGKILNDPEAMKLWERAYEPAWEPKV